MDADMSQVSDTSPPAWHDVEVRVRVGSILAVLLAVVGAILVRNVFIAAHRTLAWAFAAAVMAVLLTPVVTRLSRHLPRLVALVATVLGAGLFAALLWAGVQQQIVNGLEELKAAAPEAAVTLEQRYGWAESADVTSRVDDLVARIDTPTDAEQAGRIVGTASSYFVPAILMLFLMVYGPSIVEGAIGQIPAARRERARTIIRATVSDGRAQILVVLVQTVIITLAVSLAATVIDLPAPIVLGLMAGLIGIVPGMGIIVGSLPTALLALVIGGVASGLAVLGIALGLQLLETIVVRPRIRRRMSDVGPALILIVTLVAFSIYGVGAATYAYLSLVMLMALVAQLADAHDEAVSA